MEKTILLNGSEFNPDVIMNSGQVFRMYCENGIYRALSGSNDVSFFVEGKAGKVNITFVCEETQWEFWKKYFDLEADYGKYLRKVKKVAKECDDEFLLSALDYARGMRILKQDTWETFISYMISQNNNIPKIKKTIQILCDRYSDGEKFPEPEAFALASVDELASGTALGYRAEYLFLFAKQVIADGGVESLKRFEEMKSDAAVEELLKIKGVGPKVANCINLYGLHHMDSYPIDTWMKKIIAEDYKRYSLKEYMEYIGKYAGFEGFVQQLQFYTKRKSSIKSKS